MTIATLRRDGYPQATTVTYVNDGLDIYFGCDRTAQKIRNIKHDSKVSLTIDRDYRNWSQIKGLSMAANAYILADRDEIDHAARLLAKKFAQWAQLSAVDRKAIRFVKVVPKIISILDYTKGFGHTELVRA
jgi:general stress protein 26